MSLHQFQTISDFLYVCQSVHYLTSLLKFGYLWITVVLDEPSFSNSYTFLVCLSVHCLAYILTDIRPIQGYLLFWMRYLSENFWRHSWDVFTLFLKKYKLFVCLSVCYFANFLTQIRQIWGYLLFLMRYLSEIFGRHSCE